MTRKLLSSFLLSFLFFSVVLLKPLSNVDAFRSSDCADVNYTFGGFGRTGQELAKVHENDTPVTISFKINQAEISPGRPDDKYALKAYDTDGILSQIPIVQTNYIPASPDGTVSFTFNAENGWWTLSNEDKIHVYLYSEYYAGVPPDPSCFLGHITIDESPDQVGCDGIEVLQKRIVNGAEATCWGNVSGTTSTSCINSSETFTVRVKGLKYPDKRIYDGQVSVVVGNFIADGVVQANYPDPNTGNLEVNFYGALVGGVGEYDIELRDFAAVPLACKGKIVLSPGCNDPQACNQTSQNVVTGGNTSAAQPFKLCDQIKDNTLRGECINCAGSSQDGGVWTAIGCIKREPTSIAQSLIKIGLGTGGGVALLMILGAGFMLTTSQGDPKKVNDAKEMVTAAVTGLLFIIFSVTILQFIGVSVFKIPGLGG